MRRAGLAALAVSVLVLAACGGSGKRLTQAQFDARLAAICVSYHERAEKDIVPNSAVASARLMRQFEHVNALFRAEIEDVRSLRPPSHLAARYSEALRIMGLASNAVGRAARAARKWDQGAVNAAVLDLGRLGRQIDSLDLLPPECE